MNDDSFGFKAGDLSVIIGVLAQFTSVKKAVIFGSRAKGNYKPGSDVDMAVWLEGDDITAQLSGMLNDETMLPYKFDVINYNTINNKDLTEHINRVGIVFYQKQV